MTKEDMLYIAETLNEMLGDDGVKLVRELKVIQEANSYTVSLTLSLPLRKEIPITLHPTVFLPEEKPQLEKVPTVVKVAKKIAAVPMTAEQIRDLLAGDEE